MPDVEFNLGHELRKVAVFHESLEYLITLNRGTQSDFVKYPLFTDISEQTTSKPQILAGLFVGIRKNGI